MLELFTAFEKGALFSKQDKVYWNTLFQKRSQVRSAFDILF